MLLQYRRWVPSSSSSAAAAGDLSLSFNAGPTSESGGGGGGGGFGAGMWSASSPNYRQQQISYGVPNEIGMMGFRDMFVLAPAATFHYGNNNHQHFQEPTLSFDTNIPLLSASPYIQSNGIDEGVINGGTHCREIHFQQPAETYNNIKKPGICGATNKATTSACITCRDCGNQAKKGCSFKRCRTCCKSRGYDCSTHVKSTWVPAVRRRERQLMGSGGGGGGDFVVGSAGSSQSINSSSSKKPKVVPSQTTAASHASTSNTTPPTSVESGSSHQADHRDVDGKSFAAGGDGSYYNKESLPGQVRAPAVFKCVRVTAMDDGDDEYAYQATVKIGGHVFKGFLYDQGVSDQVSREGIPSMSDLHLGGGGGGGGGRRDGGDSSSSPAVQNMLHSSDVYGISGGHLIGGSSSSFIC